MAKEIFNYDIKPRDVAYHSDIVSDGYYEWWYLDGRFREGFTYAVMFCPRAVFPIPPAPFFGGGVNYCDPEEAKLPVLDLHITTPDKVAHHSVRAHPLSGFKASTETCDVTIGKSSLTGKFNTKGLPEEFRVKLDQDGLVADLTYRVKVTGVKFTERESGYTYANPITKKYYGWWPVAPKSEIEGIFKVPGWKEAKVSGVGYHDHNAGNYSFRDTHAKWFWGNIHVGDYTAIWTFGPAGSRHRHHHFSPFVLWKNNKVVLNTFRFYNLVEEWGIEPTTRMPYPIRETLRAFNGELEVIARILPGTFNVQTKIVDTPAEWAQGEPYSLTDPGAYFRQFGDVELEIRRGDQIEELRSRGYPEGATRELGWLSQWFPFKE